MRTLVIVLSLLLSAVVHAEPYRIGVILPLSGENASLGNYVKNGIDLAYDKLGPDRAERVTLYYEDDQLQSTRSVSAFQKLVATNHIQAVFVLGSGIGHAIAPLAEQKGIISVAIGASDGSIVHGKKRSFIHWITPEAEAKELTKEVIKRGYKRLSLITAEQEGAIAVLTAVEAELKRAGLGDRIVFNERVLPDTVDFKTQVAKLRGLNVDAMIVLLFPQSIAAFSKQARAANLSGDFVGLELFEDESVVKAAEGALRNQWYVNADEASPTFRNDYVGKFGAQPGWGTANAYDTLELVADAAKKFGNDNGKIAQFLQTLSNYSGAAGNYSASGDNRFNLPAAVKVVTDQGFEKLYR